MCTTPASLGMNPESSRWLDLHFDHVFSPDAFKMPPNEEPVVSCRFGAGGQSHPPSCGCGGRRLEVGRK